MKPHLTTAKNFIAAHHKKIIAIAIATIVIAALTAIIIVNLQAQKLAYEPVKACDLFTAKEAHNLLGQEDKDVVGNVTEPVISGDTATSKCSFSSLSINENNVTVAAIAVRSAVSKEGVSKNKDEFNNMKKQVENRDVANLGDVAYFNPQRGQLNVLDGRQWLIISYGQGNSPETNTLEMSLELATIALGHLHKKE